MNKLKKSTIIILVIVVAVIAIIGVGVSQRNKMVTLETQVSNSWANVESSYQRRMDLIPNLVSTVKGYAKHEQTTLTDVTAMRGGAQVEKAGQELEAASRAAATQNGPDAQAVSPERYRQLDRAFNLYINAVHEAYPQLMASENFMDLQKQLEGTENRINTERNRYNEAVTTYNTYVRTFPQNLVANMCGFQPKQFFKADAQASVAPTVSFEN